MEFRVVPGALVVRPQGEVDLSTAPVLGEKVDDLLLRRDVSNLVIDLREVRFMDSSGLGFILGRYKRVKRAGGSMCLIGGSPAVKAVLDVSGVSRLIAVHSSESAALRSLSDRPAPEGGSAS